MSRIYESIIQYYNKGEEILQKLVKTICIFEKLLQKNKELTYRKDYKNNNFKFMLTKRNFHIINNKIQTSIMLRLQGLEMNIFRLSNTLKTLWLIL